MRIALINSQDFGGGAAGIARSLGERLLERGHEVAMIVGIKRTTLPWVYEVPIPGSATILEKALAHGIGWATRQPASNPSTRHWTRRALHLAEWRSALNQRRGFEDFELRGCRDAIRQLPFKPDLIHAHNLHAFVGRTHFDLRALPHLAAGRSLVLTLHDTWAFTGHCAYFFGCERWRTGCGTCPDLAMYPAINHDRTRENLQIKAEIYRKLNYTLTGPSNWVVQCARESILRGGMATSSVIPNGIDLDFFSPAADPVAVRKSLGLKDDERGLAFISDLGRNTPYRDYRFVEQLAENWRSRGIRDRLVVFEVGGEKGERTTAHGRIIGTGVLTREGVRDVLQASTALLHPAKTDNFPTVILESLACGTPVIGSNVGGIPEQIRHGLDGFLYASGDLAGAQNAMQQLIDAETQNGEFRRQARLSAESRFDERRMVDNYEALYAAAIAQRTLIADVGQRT